MHPEFSFSLFGFSCTARAYGVFAALAALSVLSLAPPLLRRAGLKPAKGLALALLLLASFLVGARLLNLAVHPRQYGTDLRVWSLRLTGFSLYGGLMAAGIALPVLSRAFRISPWAAADALVLPGGMAFALARVGCFLNGCCAGIPTDSPLGMVFPRKPSALGGLLDLLPFVGGLNRAVYPTQLFEMALALAGLAIALPLVRRLNLAAGSAALLYAVWFTAARWAVLPLRSLPYDATVTEVFYPALYGSILLVCAWLFYRRNRKEAVG